MLIMLCVRSFLLTIMLAISGISYAEERPSGQPKLQGLKLGVYQTRSEIDEIATKLRQLGFETKVQWLKQGYIVNAGVFSRKVNLRRAVNRLKKAGLSDKVYVVKMNKKQTKAILAVKPKKTRSTVFSGRTAGSQGKDIMDEYVPKKDYVKLEQEVGTLKAQMQLLLEKLALTEHDLTKEQKPKAKEAESQKVKMAAKNNEGEADKTEQEKNTSEPTREEEAEEAKRGLDTFLRGKKVMYRPGELEVELGLSYGQGTTVNTFGFLPNSNQFNTTTKLTTRSVDGSFKLRYGIVDDLEFDLTVPYGYFEQNNDNQPFNTKPKPECTTGQVSSEIAQCTEPGSPSEVIKTSPVSHENAVGVGDVSGTLSYNVMSESGNIPTVTLSLSGQAPTGNYNRGLGAGFWSVGGSMSLVKTIDPVVFFGSFGYAAAFEERGVDPSDTISYSLGAGYSMNDRVSFSTSLSGSITGRTEENGIKRPGSSMDAHSLSFSSTIQLSKRLSIEPYVGFGLTEDASDFSVGVRFPYRFEHLHSLPFFSD